MEISSAYDDQSELRFICRESGDQIVVTSHVNLIDNIFQKLTTLYFKNPMKISAQYIIGQLLGAEAASHQMIGSVVPLAMLEGLCKSAVSYSNILSFLQVCKCLHAGLQMATSRNDEVGNVSEHSASALWSLIILSEVFGVHKVHVQCAHMLEEKFATAGGKLVGAVGSVFADAEVNEVETNLGAYLDRFGSAQYTLMVTAAKSKQTTITAAASGIAYGYSDRSEDSGSRNQTFASASQAPHAQAPGHFPPLPPVPSPSRYAAAHDQQYEDAVPYRPQHQHLERHTQQEQHQYIYHRDTSALAAGHIATPIQTFYQSTTPSHAAVPSAAPTHRPNPHEAHHTYDFSSVMTTHQPAPATNQRAHNAPHTPSYALYHSKYGEHEHYHTTLPLPVGVHSSPQTDWDSNTNNSDSAESVSDIYTEPENHLDAHYESLCRYEAYLRGTQARDTSMEPREHDARRSDQSLDRSQGLRASADPGRATSPAFGSATPRFPPPPSYSTLAGAVQLTPARRAASTGRGSLSDSRRQELGTTGSTSSHSGSATSPQTDLEHEYDSEHERRASRHVTRPASRGRPRAARRPTKVLYEPEAPSRSSKASLTAEDLRISRDIAKLRLQEAKVKEELEASRLYAEREMRENRLRALELKAAVARAPRSPYTSIAVVENTRHNASIGREHSTSTSTASRSRSPSKSPLLQNTVGSSSRDVASVRDPQRFIAEDAQQRAAQRVRDAKKAQDRRDAMERAAQEAKQNQKWMLRDRKLEVYKEKQKCSLGFTDYAPTGADRSQGVSTQWLQGTVSNPQRKVAATPGAFKSEQHGPQKYRYSDSPPEPQDQWTDEDRHASNDIVRSGLYSAEALAAVGLGLSPNSKLAQEQHQPQQQHTALPPPAPPSPVSIATATDLISLRIVRAWDLPECLGGTCAYVVVDWGRLGKSATHPVRHSTEPQYGSMLQFKSPYMLLNTANRDAVLSSADVHALRTESGAEYASHAGPMRVYVYNRNESVSDELIASGELDLHEDIVTTDAGQPCILYLTDPSSQPAGCMEYVVKHALC